MAATLDGVRAKIAWARHHLNVLQADMNRLVAYDPNAPVGSHVDLDFDAGEAILRWSEHFPIPVEWALLIGETFYNLRSALDHLAWQLVIANGNTPVKSEFPVFHDEGQFEKRPSRYTEGMAPDAIAVIKSLQPFEVWPQNPTHTTLWRIHDLCNIDKHRLLHLTDLWIITVELAFRFPGLDPARVPHFEKVYMTPRKKLEPGTMLAHIKWDPAEMRALGKAPVEMEVNLGIDVALSEGDWVFDNGKPAEGMGVLHAIQQAINHMEQTVVPAFERFFA